MTLFPSNSLFSRVTALAEVRAVHGAFAWLHGNPKTIMDWQVELTAIPGPPFGEEARSRWMAARFREAKLSSVETDAVGNVTAWLPAAGLPPESTGPVVVISAHLDTVFPFETLLKPVVNGDRITAPGVCDNGAGVVGMLAVAHALVQSQVEVAAPILFLATWARKAKATCAGCAASISSRRWPVALPRTLCWTARGRRSRDPGSGQPPLSGDDHWPWRAQLYRCGHA